MTGWEQARQHPGCRERGSGAGAPRAGHRAVVWGGLCSAGGGSLGDLAGEPAVSPRKQPARTGAPAVMSNIRAQGCPEPGAWVLIPFLTPSISEQHVASTSQGRPATSAEPTWEAACHALPAHKGARWRTGNQAAGGLALAGRRLSTRGRRNPALRAPSGRTPQALVLPRLKVCGTPSCPEPGLGSHLGASVKTQGDPGTHSVAGGAERWTVSDTQPILAVRAATASMPVATPRGLLPRRPSWRHPRTPVGPPASPPLSTVLPKGFRSEQWPVHSCCHRDWLRQTLTERATASHRG